MGEGRGPLPVDDDGGAGGERTIGDRSGRAVRLGPVRESELGALYALFDAVVAAREGFPHAPPLTRATFDATWVTPGTTTVVARVRDTEPASEVTDGTVRRGGVGDGTVPDGPVPDGSGGADPDGTVVAGAYYLRPNFVGRAAHIANAGYVVGAGWRGRGIGRLLVEDSVVRAPLLGFDAIQFNLCSPRTPPAPSTTHSVGARSDAFPTRSRGRRR